MNKSFSKVVEKGKPGPILKVITDNINKQEREKGKTTCKITSWTEPGPSKFKKIKYTKTVKIKEKDKENERITIEDICSGMSPTKTSPSIKSAQLRNKTTSKPKHRNGRKKIPYSLSPQPLETINEQFKDLTIFPDPSPTKKLMYTYEATWNNLGTDDWSDYLLMYDDKAEEIYYN